LIRFASIALFLIAQASAAEKILWTSDLNAALAAAKKENKLLMIDFMADWCAPCKEMERSTFSNAAVVLKARSFMPVRIDIEKQREVAAKYNALARAYGGIGIPNMLFMASDGKKLRHVVGFQGPEQLLTLMDSVLKSAK
jgi:thioredoxin:protein disulfide reductase